jgi:hypothetical protein
MLIDLVNQKNPPACLRKLAPQRDLSLRKWRDNKEQLALFRPQDRPSESEAKLRFSLNKCD